MGGVAVPQVLGCIADKHSRANLLGARLEDHTFTRPQEMGPPLFAQKEKRALNS